MNTELDKHQYYVGYDPVLDHYDIKSCFKHTADVIDYLKINNKDHYIVKVMSFELGK